MAHPLERHHGLGGRGSGRLRQISQGDGGMKVSCSMVLMLASTVVASGAIAAQSSGAPAQPGGTPAQAAAGAASEASRACAALTSLKVPGFDMAIKQAVI